MSGWQIMASILQSLAAIVVAGVAVIGLRKWRKDIVWKRKFEVAERALTLFYKAEYALNGIRFPYSSSYESEGRPKDENEPPEISKERDIVFIPFARLMKEKELFAEMHTLRFSFMALFGKERVGPFDTVHWITSEIQVASKNLVRSAGKTLHPNAEQHYNKMRDIIWNSGENDPIENRIKEAITQMEETCRPYLK